MLIDSMMLIVMKDLQVLIEEDLLDQVYVSMVVTKRRFLLVRRTFLSFDKLYERVFDEVLDPNRVESKNGNFDHFQSKQIEK